MWLHCTPHSNSSTKLALNVPPAYKPIRLAAGVKRWWQNNGLVWVKWPVLAQWCCTMLAKETAWLIWLASHNGSRQVFCRGGGDLYKERQANRQYVPLWASFCRRILRRCRAEEETSYVYRSAAANSWHRPNTPSTKKKKRGKWWKPICFDSCKSERTWCKM